MERCEYRTSNDLVCKKEEKNVVISSKYKNN